MQTVLDHITARNAAFARLPLFEHLHGPHPDPRRALGFMRNAAHFVMAFADLNKFCFRHAPAPDLWQELVNAHTREDDHHWPWYLNDLQVLGVDERQTFTEALRFIWSDQNRATRLLSYRLWAMAEGATPLQRLVIIEAIEATGLIFFGGLISVARRIPGTDLPRPLIYVGEHHVAMEQGHAGGQDNHDERLAAEVLSPAERPVFLTLVDRVFDHFTDWVQELHRHATAEAEVRAPQRLPA